MTHSRNGDLDLDTGLKRNRRLDMSAHSTQAKAPLTICLTTSADELRSMSLL